MGQLAMATDGALNYLREKGDKEGEFEQIGIGIVAPTVHINEIAGCLKGVKRDAKWQKEGEQVDSGVE
jgi:hypothetical protein